MKHRLIAGVFASTFVAAVQAQSCNTVDCTGVDIGPWTALPPSTDPGGFVPDRRPVVHIPTWIGGTTGLRLAPWWSDDNDNRDANGSATPNSIPDGFDNLMRRLNTLYDRGYRRFSLKLPAGDPDIDTPGNTYKMSSAQWWTMSSTRRALFEGMVKDWIDDKALNGDPVDMAVYMGYHVADPCDHEMKGADLFDDATFEGLDPGDPNDAAVIEDMMCRFKQNIQPWIDAGFTEFWFDNSSPNGEFDPLNILFPTFLKLANNPDYVGNAKFHGEAVPVSTAGCSWTMETDAIYTGAWVQTFSLAEHRHSNVDVSTDTEIHLWLSEHTDKPCGTSGSAYGWDFEILERYANNDWILDPEYVLYTLDVWSVGYATCNYEYFSRRSNGTPVPADATGSGFLKGSEMVQRIYDMGYIASIADFNGDGKIEVDPSGLPGARNADLLMFYVRWFDSYTFGSTTHRFIDGDVNNDGLIDMDDFDFFGDAATDYLNFRSNSANNNAEYTAPTTYRVDLGDPD